MSNTFDAAVKAGLVTLARRGMVLAGDIRENQLDGVEVRGRLCRSNMRQTHCLGGGRERKRRRGWTEGAKVLSRIDGVVTKDDRFELRKLEDFRPRKFFACSFPPPTESEDGRGNAMLLEQLHKYYYSCCLCS